MRILNLKDFKDDVDIHLRVSKTPQEDMYISWVVSHYFKDVVTDKASQFLFKISHTSSILGMDVDLLSVSSPSGSFPISIYSESEWDTKDAKSGNLFYYFIVKNSLTMYRDDICNIRDYVYSLLIANPKEDLKRRNRDDMRRASEEWHRIELARLARYRQEAEELAYKNANNPGLRNLYGSDITTFGKEAEQFTILGEQYKLVRLLTDRSLANESLYMEHCVHSYTEQVRDPNHLLLSLRKMDKLDVPLVTIHLNQESNSEPGGVWFWLVQSKAKYNSVPESQFPGFDKELSRIMKSWLQTYSSFKKLSQALEDKSQVNNLTFEVKIK